MGVLTRKTSLLDEDDWHKFLPLNKLLAIVPQGAIA